MAFSFDNEAFRAYAISAGILVIKTLAMAPLTARHRFSNKAFANPEDRGAKNVAVNADVERVRRAHLNDLENIPVFLLIAFLFLFTEPSAWAASVYFYTFTAARLVHTVSYLNGLQPWRALSWAVGFFTTIGLAVQVLLRAW